MGDGFQPEPARNLSQWLLPLLDGHQVKLIDTIPSLHPHYGTSPLLRLVLPLGPAPHPVFWTQVFINGNHA